MFSQKMLSTHMILRLPGLLLIAAILACNFEVGIVEPTPTPITRSEENDLDTITETEEQIGVEPSLLEVVGGCHESQLAGLVFSSRGQNGESLWQVGTCGGHIQLSTQTNVQISPGGDRALYVQDDDIWIVDFLSRDQQNLTNTPDRIEEGAQWWPGHDDLILFGSWDPGEDLGISAGYLSIISVDGDGYRVLGDQPSEAIPAPQPGGSMIAFNLEDGAWFYDLDSGESESFDVRSYGLDIHEGIEIGSPSWSPDGKKLTWWVSGSFSPSMDGSVALVIFDLEDKNVQVLHPYSPNGTGGGLPKPVWSPDGKQLAMVTLGEAHKVDLWVIDAEDGGEHLLGFASNPVWHPDSDALVYQAWSVDVIKMIDIYNWELQTLDLPPGSTPLFWPDVIQDFVSEGQLPTPDTEPAFGPAIYFAASPEMAGSRSVFPFRTSEICVIWPYRNMRSGLTVRREWYLDGDLWLDVEELWDYAKYGIEGILTDVSIYDFEKGLEPGRYQLRLYIDGREQQLGLGEEFSSASFEISAPIEISPHVSPDYSQMAIVEPPGTLIIQDVETQERNALLTVEEISSLAWYPDGEHILYSVRDRSGQQPMSEPFRFSDALWVLNLETGETYPFQDQFGQNQGEGLHHPYVSPDGLYIAAFEGSGWADACFVASKLWVKEVAFEGRRLQEVFSHSEYSFAINPAPGHGEMYLKRIIGWDSPTLLKVELGWNCTTENLDGIYTLNMSTMTAEKVDDSNWRNIP
jgi:Tol biopolymer transport system component